VQTDKTIMHPKAKLQNAPTYQKQKPLSCLFTFDNKNKNLYLLIV